MSTSMSVAVQPGSLVNTDTGSEVIEFLMEGLGYEELVDFDDISINPRDSDWDEARLTDENGVLIRYIELGSSDDSNSWSDLRRELKNHGSPVGELMTVIGYREEDSAALSSPLDERLTFLRIEERFSPEDVEVAFDLKYFHVDRSEIEPAYLDFFNENLSVTPGQTRARLAETIDEIFSIQQITNRFYEDFGVMFRDDLQDAISGLENEDENLDSYTQTVVNRVLFLLFVEEKGWLDDDENYIENRYEDAKERDDMEVYEDFFEPLFFDALCDRDSGSYEFLGRIPFLNGGLFDKREIERDVSIDEPFFDALLDPTPNGNGEPEGFLRRYKISLSESNPSEQELVVDPEFVGRIFEMFMQEDDRSEIGAFYTPKPITMYMAKNALKRHLLNDVADLSHDEAVEVVNDAHNVNPLDAQVAREIRESLTDITVLDPAVGSGAFIIAVLEELVEITEALDDLLGDDQERFELKEQFISHNLYGVDVDPQGIELCKFRTWLHLMQDLDATHEEFLEANDRYALPNLGFKFFVGNSLVGDHDPLGVNEAISTSGYQSVLNADNSEKSLREQIATKRVQYTNAHGAEKDSLADELKNLSETLDGNISWEKFGHGMDEVVSEIDSDDVFKWSVNIPEVVLGDDGGFDIVIGNPPYEGQSQQDFIGELSRFYDNKYDFYKTIPRMRHDLYQKFIIRGWELTTEGGVFSYITSNTFYTIGSKQSTRNLLLENKLHDLIRANPNTFDATVNPAIFSLTKDAPDSDHPVNYTDASETEPTQYRSFVRFAAENQARVSSRPAVNIESNGSGRTDDSAMHTAEQSEGVRTYDVPIKTYRDTLRSAFFEPTEGNLRLHRRFMSRMRSLTEQWEDEIRDSDTLEENLDVIKREHIDHLKPGNISILGLLTIGGQGLATASNDEYLAYIDGTRPAEKVKDRNESDFSYVERNENQYSWMSRVINEEHIADVDELSEEQEQSGISTQSGRTWVPIIKGRSSR